MPCTNCTKRAGRVARQQNIVVNQPLAINNGITNMVATSFTLMYFVGDSGEIASVEPNIFYGFREKGAVMQVHDSDIQANPNLWVKELPNDEVADIQLDKILDELEE